MTDNRELTGSDTARLIWAVTGTGSDDELIYSKWEARVNKILTEHDALLVAAAMEKAATLCENEYTEIDVTEAERYNGDEPRLIALGLAKRVRSAAPQNTLADALRQARLEEAEWWFEQSETRLPSRRHPTSGR